MSTRDVRKIPITWTADESQPIAVADFQKITITVVGTGTATISGSGDKDVPDFTAASTITNSHVPILVEDQSAVAALATTLVVAGATKIGQVNATGLTWVQIARSVGTLDAFVTLSNNA